MSVILSLAEALLEGIEQDPVELLDILLREELLILPLEGAH